MTQGSRRLPLCALAAFLGLVPSGGQADTLGLSSIRATAAREASAGLRPSRGAELSAVPSRPAPEAPEPGAGPTTILGEPRVLLSAGSLGLDYFPDMALTVLDRVPRFRALLTAGVSTWLVEGDDLDRIAAARVVLQPGPPGSFDNGYAGVSGAVRLRDGTWLAAYHGEDHEGMPPIPGGIPGFFCTIGLALSRDSGRTWEKRGPILSSAKPKEWAAFPGQADRGAGEPWLVATPDGKWLMLYYADHSRVDGRGVQIFAARARVADVEALIEASERVKPRAPGPNPRKPGTRSAAKNPAKPVSRAGAYSAPGSLGGAWKKWHAGAFVEPGLGGLETEVMSERRNNLADAYMPWVAWSRSLDRWVMLFNRNEWKEYVEGSGLRHSGIFVAFSRDGVEWSEPEMLVRDWSAALLGKPVSWHPAIVWDAGSDTAGWLVYGWSPGWGHRHDASGVPHHLAGRRIEFRR